MRLCTLHRTLSCLTLIGLLLRVIVPVGFMPASLSDGWYLKWCPGGMHGSVLAVLLDHEHHHHHADDSARDVQCDLGNAFSSPAMSMSTLEAAALLLQPMSFVWEIRTQVGFPTLPAYESRAPPRTPLLV